MTRHFFTAMLFLLAGVQTAKAQKQGLTAEGKVKVVLYMAGNQTFECNITQLDSITFEEEHEWVDLGLPSGTLWATCNVGANSPDEYGDYFAWGETKPKSEYSWSTYKWMNEGQSSESQINKYTFADGYMSACWYDGNGMFIGDGLTELLPEDDAATANWGNGWQMPSLSQCQELNNKSYTITTDTTENDVYGKKITSRSNSNSIFLPAAGYYSEKTLYEAGGFGGYWPRSLEGIYSDRTYGMDFFWGMMDTGGMSIRLAGLTVRPVRVQTR